MREDIRRERKIPRFRPIPTHLRRHMGVPKQYARFYVNYETKNGIWKRSSFHIRIPNSASGSMNNKMIRFTCNKIKDFKMIPLLKHGEEVTFGELHQRTQWIKVRRIKYYEAGMFYEK